MPPQDWAVHVQPEHGGRWSSLRDPSGHEWLWSRPDPARAHVRPGQRFVDVGGLEECLPTIGGEPDHGDLWSQPWRTIAQTAEAVTLEVETSDCRLTRTHLAGPDGVRASYTLEAAPDWHFLWAAHVLLDPRVGTRILAPEGHDVLAFPGHQDQVATSWPSPLGKAYDQLGEDDGSAMFVILPGLLELSVDNGDQRLTFLLEGDDNSTASKQPYGMGLWRNLGGYPWDAPTYRNFGVEPMIGRDFRLDRAAARQGDTGVMPTSGRLQWSLTIGSG